MKCKAQGIQGSNSTGEKIGAKAWPTLHYSGTRDATTHELWSIFPI